MPRGNELREWSVGSTDLSHLISTINGDRKALTTQSLMIGHHSHWFALKNILWLPGEASARPTGFPTARSEAISRNKASTISSKARLK